MNKTITIDNQEYELVPIVKYTAGDWVLYNNGGTRPVVRRIVSDNEWKEFLGSGLDDKYGEWMTEAATKQYVKDIVRKANLAEIEDYLISIARKKGFKVDAKIRGIGKTVFHKAVQNTIDYHVYDDTLAMSGIIIYQNGIWAEIEEEPKFTFGKEPVEFDVMIIDTGHRDREVTITCRGTKGTATQLANILTHFFRPMPFGNVFVKAWTLKGQDNHTCPDGTFKIPSFSADTNNAYVDEITIGCLTGKYSELEVIYKKSQEILKNWKPAKGFDK